MGFEQFAVLRRAGEFQAERRDLAVGAAAVDGQDPGQDVVNHDLRLDFGGLGADELDGGFVAGGANADFLGAGQFFVTGYALESVAEGTAADSGDGAGLVALQTRLGPQLQADCGVGAGLTDGAPEGEQLGGCGVDFLLLEEAGRQVGSAEHHRNGDLVFAEPCKPDAGHLKSVTGDFGCSHGFKIALAGNPSLAECAKILARCAT